MAPSLGFDMPVQGHYTSSLAWKPCSGIASSDWCGPQKVGCTLSQMILLDVSNEAKYL